MGNMAPADCATPALVVGSNLLKWGRPSCEQGAGSSGAIYTIRSNSFANVSPRP